MWLLSLLLVLVPVTADAFPTKYDSVIEDAWELYHPGDDWRWYKAQLWQESLLKPDAVSPVGAVGLSQMMPGTWTDVPLAVRLGAIDRRLAGPSIHAGSWYMRRMMRFWKSRRPHEERRKLAQASYNAGAGSLLKAQKRCGWPRAYEPIVECLPLVTGRHSRETITYVQRIRRWYLRML